MDLITGLPNYYIYNGIYLNERLKTFFIEFSKIYNSIYYSYIDDYKAKIKEVKDSLTMAINEFDEKCRELSSKGIEIHLDIRGYTLLVAKDGEILTEIPNFRKINFDSFLFNSCNFDDNVIEELDLYLEKQKNANIPFPFLPKSIEREYNTYLEVHKKLDMDVKKAIVEANEYKKKHIFLSETRNKKYKALIDNYQFANETLYEYENENLDIYEKARFYQNLKYEDLVLIKEIYILFIKINELLIEITSIEMGKEQTEYDYFKITGEEAIEKMLNSGSKWLDEIEYVKSQLFKIHLKKCLEEQDKSVVKYGQDLGFNMLAVEAFITIKKEEIDSLGYILLDKIDEGILLENKGEFKTLKKKMT